MCRLLRTRLSFALALLWIFAATTPTARAQGTGNLGPLRGDCQATEEQIKEAARFLSQATLGAPAELVGRVACMGPDAWFEEQLATPVGRHLPIVASLYQDIGVFEELVDPNLYRRFAFWQQALNAPDPVRQRVAMALSEIFVISDRSAEILNRPATGAAFYDVLLEHSFGSFEELLLAVTLHPAMGSFLSHMNNRKGDAETGRFPDENYAREVMQLFSIGLFELDRNGRPQNDRDGNPIPTYGNSEITELAKVFTGLGPGGLKDSFGNSDFDPIAPMRMYEEHHEPGEKRIFRDIVIPAEQSGMEDVAQAIHHLAEHPNVGAFIGAQLIQRLVTSNPSPGYVRSVARVFEDNGKGVRGDLAAVVRQVLFDPRARRFRYGRRPSFGRVQEPFVRHVAMARTFRASSPSGVTFSSGGFADFLVGQHVLSAPSVFNFFSPEHSPSDIRRARFVAPELQITTSSTVIGMVNLSTNSMLADEPLSVPLADRFYECAEFRCRQNPTDPICEGITRDPEAELPSAEELFFCSEDWVPSLRDLEISLDLGPEIEIAANAEDLVSYLDLLLTYGTLSRESRQTVLDAITPLPDPEFRVRLAIHLISISPDYAVAN